MRVAQSGEALSRLGYEATTWDLGTANYGATSYYVPRYNVTFFALSTKVYYIEHDRSDAVIDTGIALTQGTITRMGEYSGDLFITNTTDGIRQIHIMRLNDSAPNSGDASVTVDQDGGGRLNAFTHTSGNLRIRGTNEAFTACSTAGAVTLTGTLSQTYADNDIALVIVDISSGKPKGSKLTFWKDRMVVIGVESDTSADVAPSVAYMSKFATSRTAENVIAFGISGGASEELVGKAGRLTNVVSTRDYLYLFKEDETYFSSVSDVDTSTGATFPQLMSTNYGCVNEDCAVDLGSGLIVFLTKNKRIIGIRIATESGAATVFPDESFDAAIRNTLGLLDADQSASHMFYHKAARLLFVQVSVQGEILTLVYDNNIKKWLPPDTNKVMKSYFEKAGILYGTAKQDDTIYQMDIGTTDDGMAMECVIAHGEFDPAKGRSICEWEDVELSGGISALSTITVETIVNGGGATPKIITTEGVNFENGRAVGDIVIGETVLGGGSTEIVLGDYAKRLRIAPSSYGLRYQTILSSTQPFSVKSYNISAKASTESQLTLS